MEEIIENLEYNTDIVKITLCKVVDRPGIAADIFSLLGQHGINVELISSTSIGHQRANISFIVGASELDEVLQLLKASKDKFGTSKFEVDKDCGLIAIYGEKLSSAPGIAGKIFEKLSEQGINIDMISASLTVLSIVVKKARVKDAVAVIKG